MIPFNVSFTPENRDKKLGAKLKQELPGILNWALEGCLRWQSDGLGTPDEVAKATQGYRAEMDKIGRFIEENCEIRESHSVKMQVLYDGYRTWCELSGESPLPIKTFSLSLDERGYGKKRTSSGFMRLGLGFKMKGAG